MKPGVRPATIRDDGPPPRLVVAVRKEPCRINGVTHEHVVGVFTADGESFTNAEVTHRLREGEVWQVALPDRPPIRVRSRVYCPFEACVLSPYLWVGEDPGGRNELETMLPCW